MKNFTLGLLLALAVSSSSMEKHPDGSITLLPAEAVMIDYEVQMLKYNLGKTTSIIKYLEKRLQELENGVCI